MYTTNDNNYTHFEGNSHDHMKSSTVVSSQTLIIHEGETVLGCCRMCIFMSLMVHEIESFMLKL